MASTNVSHGDILLKISIEIILQSLLRAYSKLIKFNFNICSQYSPMAPATICCIKSCILLGYYANYTNLSKLYCSDHRSNKMVMVRPSHSDDVRTLLVLTKKHPKYMRKSVAIPKMIHQSTQTIISGVSFKGIPPDMTIYDEIKNGQFQVYTWKQLARTVPLLTYLRK